MKLMHTACFVDTRFFNYMEFSSFWFRWHGCDEML